MSLTLGNSRTAPGLSPSVELPHLRFNTELAKKPPNCLEYLVVHEMAHLIEPPHNARIKALMDRFLPDWKQVRKELNRTLLGYANWED